MTSTDPAPVQRFVARGPVDLIAMVPYVLGFHPEDSVVLLTFGMKGEPSAGECFHARVDLPLDPDDQAGLATYLRRVMRHHGIGCGAVLIYSSDVAAAQSQARACLRLLVSNDISLIEILRVDDGAYFDALDGDGEGIPYDVSTHPFSVQHVFEGRVTLPNREAVADTLVSSDETGPERVGMALQALPELAEIDSRPDEARWLLERLTSHELMDDPWNDRDVARLVRDIQEIELRDVAWVALKRSRAQEMTALFSDVVRRCPHELLAPPAGLLAFSAWLGGQGALAWCAVERALEADPDYSMATLVAGALKGAMSPLHWQELVVSDLPILAAPV